MVFIKIGPEVVIWPLLTISAKLKNSVPTRIEIFRFVETATWPDSENLPSFLEFGWCNRLCYASSPRFVSFSCEIYCFGHPILTTVLVFLLDLIHLKQDCTNNILYLILPVCKCIVLYTSTLQSSLNTVGLHSCVYSNLKRQTKVISARTWCFLSMYR